MDVSSIITNSRTETATSIWQITDEKYLEKLNTVYKEIFSKLATASKKYTWDTYVTDIVANQSEYILPTADTTKAGIKFVLDVFYKWEKIDVFDTNRKVFETEDENRHPYSVVRDWSIFIYPTPTENLEWWLRVEWNYIPLDLALNDAENKIKLPTEYHNILIQWLNAAIFWVKQIYDKQQLWLGYYNASLENMVMQGWSENEDWYVDMVDPFGYMESLHFMP